MKHPITLIADIGGTNARFGIVRNNKESFTHTKTLQCADFSGVESAIEAYLQIHSVEYLDALYFAVAGPIKNQQVSFTNNEWEIDCAKLCTRYNTQNIRLINDWEAIAYSLMVIEPHELLAIGGSWQHKTPEDATLGLMGPGSGLGVAGLCVDGQNMCPLITEGGHIGFSPENQLQLEILRVLLQKYKRVSNERLLSGPGLVNIYDALCQINNSQNPVLSAPEISLAAVNKTNPICEQSLAVFFEILGQSAGDLALSLGAYQGIYIGAGIAQRYPEQLNGSHFRKGFENKGRHSTLMKDIPTWLILHKNPGLLGASVFARTHF